jgi:hypothetical protein
MSRGIRVECVDCLTTEIASELHGWSSPDTQISSLGTLEAYCPSCSTESNEPRSFLRWVKDALFPENDYDSVSEENDESDESDDDSDSDGDE